MPEDDEPFFLLDEDEAPADASSPPPGSASTAGSPVVDATVARPSESVVSGLGRLASAVSTSASKVLDRTASKTLRDIDPDPAMAHATRRTATARAAPSASHSPQARTRPAEAEIIEAVEVDETTPDAGLAIDGVHTFDWPLRGMDCPDCAMKAVRATKRLPGVESVQISAITGRARVDLDIGVGRISKVAAVLGSLGHSADLDWHRVDGQTPSIVMQRRGLDRRSLRRSLLATPGVLDVELAEGRILLLRAPMFEPTLKAESDRSLAATIGGRLRLVEHRSRNLRPDQWRLLGAAATLPLLGIVTWMERAEMRSAALLFVTSIGVLFTGWRMFAEAAASIRNLVLGFQILVTFAVVGALWLGEYQEALMVTGLVALASHLEERALVRAREAMQGGLDRLPNVARVISTAEPSPATSTATGPAASPHSDAGDDHHDHADPDHDHPDTAPMVGSSAAVTSSPVGSVGSEEPADRLEMMPLELVTTGDLIEIRSGETVPVDGLVVEGSGYLDRAPLTGESLPAKVSEGDLLEAGLTLVRGPVVIEATAVGDDTRLSGLMDLVRSYREVPPRLQGTIEMFTFIWVPIVLVGAVLIGFFQGSLSTTLLLWVVACPCALLLAAPIPHAISLSVASSRGVVARGGDVLEKMARIDLALLDKTGTLTSGRPRLDSIVVAGVDEERALRLAAGLEQRSNHPYAEVILTEASDRGLSPVRITSLADGEAGVSGTLRGAEIRLGRSDWLTESGVTTPDSLQSALAAARTAGAGASMLSEDGTAIALFHFVHDDVRPGALELVTALRERGVEVELLSGDEQAAVERFGAGLGIPIEACRGGVTPEQKASWIESRTVTRRTLMAGDGFNDAAALALADVGIAVGSGDQINLDAADVLIPGDDPRAIDALLDIARRARWLVIANIALSMVLTLTLVALVVSGYRISIAAGVLLHEASALLVILNGMWIGGTMSERLGTLRGIFADVGRDFVEAVQMLIGRDPTPATD